MLSPSIFGPNMLFSNHCTKQNNAATHNAVFVHLNNASKTAGINPKNGPI